MEASPFCQRCCAPHPADAACPDLGNAPTLPPGAPGPIPLVNLAEAHSLLGEQVGSFRLERLLGSGGMGAVYLARHPAIGSLVAIKFLRREFAEDSALVRRLYAEARAANLAQHENIVRVLDMNQHPVHGFYLVMEHVAGETLAARLGKGPLALEWVEQVLQQVCAALGTAHARGVVHRDLKPENVMVVEKHGGPSVKVMDFGIAKLRESGSISGTRTGAIIGTPAYIAPEQCDGRPVDARTDVYALGVMAFELVTGQLPFPGKNAAQQMIAHLTQPPPSPRSLRPDLPASWEAAILRALAKRPEERFASTEAFADALQARTPRTPPPSAQPAEVRRQVSVAVEVVLAPGRKAVSLRAVDLSRGGALLAFDGEPPAMFSRVTVRLGGEEVAAEVVRQVTDIEARAWGTPAGFAIQFCSPSPALAARIDALVRGRPAVEPPQPSPGGALNPQQRMLLARYGAQGSASHYAVLGLSEDATRTEIVESARKAIAELRELEARPLTPVHAEQVSACLQRVATALTTLSSVRERLQYDARRGNAAGIARAIAAGCSQELLRKEREHFLRERPEVAPRVEQLLARARLARRQGKADAAARELQEALHLDPLNLELHLQARGSGQGSR